MKHGLSVNPKPLGTPKIAVRSDTQLPVAKFTDFLLFHSHRLHILHQNRLKSYRKIIGLSLIDLQI